MSIRLTNTLTGKKEEFQPLHPPEVSLYVCGITVYGETHVGHARGAVVFDVLRRFLEARGFRVEHVRNITDVDDKIIGRARQEPGSADLKTKVREVARRYEQSFRDDFSKLGALAPTHEPRATEYIPRMVRFIEQLIEAGYAYPAADGVYFSVKTFEKKFGYGHLSHQKPDQMLEGVRVHPGEGKKDPLDFALWKTAKPEEPGWPSPWGEGRPGWHIECSTMSTDLLGDEFDIHGGGQDLIFPHHENELAQSLSAGKKFANAWIHNGLLTVNGQKMSKSVGNIIRIQDVLAKYPADVLRLFFLSAHYHSPIDFTWDRMEEAKHAYERLTTFLAHCAVSGESSLSPEELEKHFFEAMEDDLNTPKALAVLFEAVSNPGKKLGEKVRRLGGILGLFQTGLSTAAGTDTQQLIQERDAARARKDFASSDKIRAHLMELGYIVEDTTAGTVVRKKL
ncbi:MAG: cysteine--tRNA ligase [Candidatus Omnitrophica bacterium]|nr:cysteine--tRNA ligase [Candidatus Omnitrophota bacterium]